MEQLSIKQGVRRLKELRSLPRESEWGLVSADGCTVVLCSRVELMSALHADSRSVTQLAPFFFLLLLSAASS